MSQGIPSNSRSSLLQLPSTSATSNISFSRKRTHGDKSKKTSDEASVYIKRARFVSRENDLQLKTVSSFKRENAELNQLILKYHPKNYNKIEKVIEKLTIQDINFQNRLGYSALISAVHNEYFDIVDLLLKHNANTELKNKFGNTALFEAVYNNNIDIVKLLITHKANINSLNNTNETVLHLVAKNTNCNKMFTFLVDSGIKTKIKDNKGFTALHCATIHNNLQGVKLLLNKGENINTQNVSGYSPLHSAINKVEVKMSELLIENGADQSLRTADGNTPLFIFMFTLQQINERYITKYSSSKINSFIKLYDRLIINKDRVVKEGVFKETILHSAVLTNSILIMRKLLSNPLIKDLINDTDYNGRTALTKSIYHSNLDISYLLIENRADCLTENNALSPIYAAIFFDKLTILKKMEKQGIPLTDNHKYYAFAICSCSINCLEYLVLKRNPFTNNAHFTWNALKNINTINKEQRKGNDPDKQEKIKKSDDCLKIVYRAIMNTSGQSPFSSDIQGWFSSKLHHQLINNRNTLEKDDLSLIRHSCIECVVNNDVSLLKKYFTEINVDFSDANGDTLIHYAAICGHLHIIKLLINEYKAKYDAFNKYKITPLSIACKYGNLDIVKYLASKGANINQAVPRYRSPLMNAIKHSQLSIVEFLLAQPQLKLDEQDNLGNLAIHYCVTPNHYTLIKKLLNKTNVNHKNNIGATPLFLLICFIRNHLPIQNHIPHLLSTIKYFLTLPCLYGQSEMRDIAKLMNPSITKLFLKNNQWNAYEFKILFQERFDKIHDRNHYIKPNYEECIDVINETIFKIDKQYRSYQSKITELISHEEFENLQAFYLSDNKKQFSKNEMNEFFFAQILLRIKFDTTNPQITKKELNFIIMYWDNNKLTLRTSLK